MADVARAAGVSKSSVSRAFTQQGLIGADTVVRILQVAKDIGFVPNHTARALSTGRHGNVALVVPDVANPFFPPLIRAAQMQADLSDFCVFLGNSDENPRQEDKLVNRFVGKVEGLLLVASRLTDERISFHAGKCPLVLINRDVAGIPRVLIDSAVGVDQAILHLADLGHRRIAYVSGPQSSWADQQRRAAVQQGAIRHGLVVNIIGGRVPSYENGRSAVSEILATPATAVIAFDDLIAQGIMTGLADIGISVPADFSVVGCDDVLGAATYPALTTVSTRSGEAGLAAMSLLLDMLASRTARDARLSLDTHLVRRATTAPPSAQRSAISPI